jgi:hypothetical protein
LEDQENIALLQQMQQMGHEISYHHDVMDSNKGNLECAIEEFERNRTLFEQSGFAIKTVCQHGNPILERKGYSSNRDFFRSNRVQTLYPEIADIMVDFPEKYETSYRYFSDAGRVFQQIYDPINNDIKKSDDQNIPYENMDALHMGLNREEGNIISTHPHRWTSSAVEQVIQRCVFKILKGTAKVLIRVPFMKKIISRFYYLAKKF